MVIYFNMKLKKQELRDLNLICSAKFDMFNKFQPIKSKFEIISWLRRYHKREKKS